MNLLASLLSPASLRLIALALLHFLWQGAALAALAYASMALCRSASARYVLAVGVLVLMAAAPVATFVSLLGQDELSAETTSVETISVSAPPASKPVVVIAKPTLLRRGNAPDYFLLLVEAWFAGVLLLSLRTAGGFLLLERLRRKESTPVSERLLALCVSLQKRMGIRAFVRYYESLHLDAPGVAGWFRPVVLLPATALTGLDKAQLEAVIAHELAHIQRFDAFVNLFQIGVETLLFYHPAVWWLGKRIRAERENCCDDTAVAFCGSPVTYAHALARMAESRVAPELVMAANRGPLAERVARLLGASPANGAMRGAALSAGVLCLSAALLAGSAFVGVVRNVHAQAPAAPVAPSPAPEPAAAPTPARAPRAGSLPAVNIHFLAAAPAAPPAPAQAPSATSAPTPATAPQAESSGTKQSYIDELKAAGITIVDVDELISLKVQGITPAYIKSMKDLSLVINVDELIGMKVQGITPEYVREMRSTIDQNLDADALIGMKVQGITPEYIKQMRDLGLKADADAAIGMKVQGITPEYIREMRGLGLKLDGDELIGMKVQGITPEYVKSINELGLHPDADGLIGMKVQGVTPAYLKELQAAGFKLDVDDAIAAKIQGITPEFIAKARSHGFKDLTLEKLIALKQSGVLDAEK